MKKIIAAAILLAMLLTGAASALANPWTETTAEGLMERLGLRFDLPQSAQNVTLQMLEAESLAHAQFSLCGVDYAMRIQPTGWPEDISGAYYEWTSTEACEVNGREGSVMYAADGNTAVSLCIWTDMAPGISYSLLARAPEKVDVLAVAQLLFVPLQGETDEDPAPAAQDIFDLLLACTGYEGTAGASLKEAVAAKELLTFAAEHELADAGDFSEVCAVACAALPQPQREELATNLPQLADLLARAFDDPAALRGLFDDAGIAGEMQSLLQSARAAAHWNALQEILLAAV